VTVPLDNAVKLLLKDVVKFQDRLYHRDPVKAFARRRYVVGFREVLKYLHLKRLKLTVIAPDLEVAKQKGVVNILFFILDGLEQCLTILLKWLKSMYRFRRIKFCSCSFTALVINRMLMNYT